MIFVLIILIIILLLIIYYFEFMRYISLNLNNHVNLSDLDIEYNYLPRVDTKERTIVSLTTIPDRINNLIPTLASIYTQTKRVDEIRLNIPYISRKGEKYIIPKYLKKLNYLKIYRTKDYGPSTKLLPSLINEKADTKIIVIDDDQIYGSKLIEELVKAFKSKNTAVTNYGTKFHYTSYDRIISYISGEEYVDVLFGCGGYILTPKMIPRDIFNYEAGPSGAVFVDDNWISGWLSRNGHKIFKLGMKQGCSFFLNISNVNTESLSGGENKNKVHEHEVNDWFKNNIFNL